jgi:hypothetical protein
MDKLPYMHIVGYYSRLKEKIFSFATIWMDLMYIVLNEKKKPRYRKKNFNELTYIWDIK